MLCAHCWASYSSRVSESAAGSVALPAGGLGKMVAFPVPVGGLRKAPTALLGRKEAGGRGEDVLFW